MKEESEDFIEGVFHLSSVPSSTALANLQSSKLYTHTVNFGQNGKNKFLLLAESNTELYTEEWQQLYLDQLWSVLLSIQR